MDMSDAIGPENIVGAWSFDEGKGNVAADSSGNGNDGELMEGPQWVQGRSGSALAFDGVGAYVNVPHKPVLQITDAVSISAWVRRTRMDDIDIILEKGGGWVGGQCNYGMSIHKVDFENMPYFYFNGGWKGAKPGVSDEGWHHYAVVAKNGENDISLYIDGVLKPVNSSGGVEVVSLFPSESDLHIGAQVEPKWKYYSASIIDEVAIFNVALTGDEVRSVMHRGLSQVLAVIHTDRLTITWASIKAQDP
jgi:hypothetical protein